MHTVRKNNDKSVYSPIRYFGGKANLADKIIELIPPHKTYCELFAGGIHVLTRKTPSKVEIINDIDSDLVNFLMILRSQKDRFVEEISTLPSSRFLFEKWAKEPFPDDDFERAIRWFYLLRQKIVPANNHMHTLGWRSGRYKNNAIDFANVIARLEHFQQRILKVLIECQDFEEIIKSYDHEGCFWFIDPPYRGREKYYKGGFQLEDHYRLHELLSNIKGKALVTHIADPLYEDLYKDWYQQSFINLAHKGVVKAERGQSKTPQTEVFYMNYQPCIQKSLF